MMVKRRIESVTNGFATCDSGSLNRIHVKGYKLVSYSKDSAKGAGPSMADVARVAGVSLSSVSRVFLGQKKVSEKTRVRVLEAAEKLGYVPSTFTHHSHGSDEPAIGLLLRDAANPSYGALFAALHVAVERRGRAITTMTVASGKQDEHQIELLDQLMSMDVAGLIVASGDLSSDLLVPFMDRVPILRLGRPEPGKRIHAVSYNEEAAGRELAQLVLTSGHSRIAVVRTQPDISFPEYTRASSAIATIRSAGLEPFIIDVGLDTGAEYVLPLVQSSAVTAVMCPTDIRQVQFIRIFENNGLKVPNEVSVTGCDGLLPGGDLMGLTTYRLPLREIAELAVDQMMDIINRFGTDEAPTTPINIKMDGELIRGRTLAQVVPEI